MLRTCKNKKCNKEYDPNDVIKAYKNKAPFWLFTYCCEDCYNTVRLANVIKRVK